MRLADAGISELQRYVDTLIVIPNQNLFRIANERTTFAEAFGMADQVLHSGVRSITDLMVLPGLINLDFADVRTVMTEMGKAMMGTGEASGEDRALMASQNAIANPLLDEVSLKGAKAVLVNVTGGLDMTLLEVDEAANCISDQVDPEANIIFGAAFDPSLEGKIRVSVVATGMDGHAITAIEPKPARTVNTAQPLTIKDAPKAAAPAPIVAQTAATRAPAETAAPPVYTQSIFEAPRPPERSLTPTFQAAPPLRAEPRRDAREQAEETRQLAHAEQDYDDDLGQGDLLQPVISERSQREPERPVARSEPRIDDAPLFPERPYRDDHRPAKGGGFRSLFGGRPRQEPPPLRDYRNDPTPVLQARAAAQQQSAVQPSQEHEVNEAGEDLEIPSFLRRLAN
jgi:cell division protein FtsZ